MWASYLNNITCVSHITSSSCVFTLLYLFLLSVFDHKIYQQSPIMWTITLIDDVVSAIRENSCKVNPSIFPKHRQVKFSYQQIHGGMPWYKVVESRYEVHGVCLCSQWFRLVILGKSVKPYFPQTRGKSIWRWNSIAFVFWFKSWGYADGCEWWYNDMIANINK